jgi:hypothetical protein
MTIITLGNHYFVLSCQPAPRGLVYLLGAMCGKWRFKHLGWVISYRGTIFKAHWARDLSGLMVYKRCSKAGPEGGPFTWRTLEHPLGCDDTRTKHDDLHQTQHLA